MMAWLGSGDYDLARFVLQRGIAAIYLLAFVSSARQFPALLGEHGLLPVPRYLARVARTPGQRFFAGATPTRCFGPSPGPVPPSRWPWCWACRSLARLAAVAGVRRAVAAVHVHRQRGPGILRIRLGDAAARGGVHGRFLGSHQVAAPVIVVWLVRWLVFRLEFGAGMIKMRGDPVLA